ncbi:MAG TPA: hypothetical protein VMA13_09115 [Candidatus Saccharimonadales bacterium]|nr:hypothetical protein [Candidatus Saccharimonadales bacterium]
MNAPNNIEVPVAWYIRALQKPTTSISLAILCLVLDFFIGPYIIFPITFILPVVVSAWFCRSYYAYALAIVQPLVRLGFAYDWRPPWGITVAIINTAIRIIVLVLFAYLVSRTARQTRQLAKRVNLLEGILPICSLCKKIRDEHNNWQPVELYVSNRSEASFSHSLCPDCLKRDYKNVPRED